MNIFYTKELSVGYEVSKNRFKIIKENINFSAKKGELIAVLGSNGIGKSTFLRTLVGLQKRVKGKFYFFGREFSTFLPKEVAKIISFVSTETVNVPNMLVKELVALGRYPHTNWLGQIGDKDFFFIKEALRLVDMTSSINKFITELSDGERQRVMIARTLAQDTPIIILDEPTAYLDLANKYLLIKTLKDLSKKKGKIIIFSTHDLNIALKMADKIWLFLHENLHEGAPEDLILNESVKNIFASSEVFFNEKILDFDIQKENNFEINIKGEGRAFELTKKALERVGYKISLKAEKTVKVKTKGNKNFWELDNNDIFENIYDLLDKLKIKVQIPKKQHKIND